MFLIQAPEFLPLASENHAAVFYDERSGEGRGPAELSISQGIIQSHNGKFYLDENSAKTRFVIWLPLS